MAELEEDIDPLTLVEDLRLGQQQIVEIARALSVDSRILIMDEPTSALSATEVEVLFKVIRDLTSRGVSIVYISHHLEEALQITDYAVVLRDGAITATAEREGHRSRMDRAQHGRRELRSRLAADRLCVRRGRPVDRGHQRRRRVRAPTCFVVDHLSLDVRAGEIVCIYGLMGAGRTELLEVRRRPRAADRRAGPARGRGRLPPQHRRAHRQGPGAGAGGSPARRARADDDGRRQPVARQHRRLRPADCCCRRPRERELIDQSIRNVHIKTAGRRRADRLALGRQSAEGRHRQDARRPTRRSSCSTSRAAASTSAPRPRCSGCWPSARRRGLAVVFSTSEVAECLSIAHRIIVMRRGRISAEFGSDVDQGRDHGRLGRSRGRLIVMNSGALTMTDTRQTPSALSPGPVQRRLRRRQAAARRAARFLR